MRYSVTLAMDEPRTLVMTPTRSATAFTGTKYVPGKTLKVLTLNIAHGRKDAMNQFFVGETTIRSNLADAAALLKTTGADIVALQEADGPSRWSGNFDHVALLAQRAEYPWYSRASHAQNWLFDYGTALLSQYEFTQVLSHTFIPSPPTPSKGFLLGQITWRSDQYGISPAVIDIVSVHLDFSRKNVRRQQVTELIEILSNRKNPVILLGDFNSDWSSEMSVVRELTRRCDLHVYRPAASDLGTYRNHERRFDWILVSKALEFKNYTVLPEVVSDHLAVVAEVFLRGGENNNDIEADNMSACVNSANI
jgi:endonuclease/exonuclease/phosphatase family metal-dependent hydrolase